MSAGPITINLAALSQAIQKQCLPGVWSKGVAFAREGALIQDRFTDEEIIYRVKLADRPVSPKVTIWPEDEDWFCTCGDRNEICAHIAAAAIVLKSGPQAQSASTASASTDILYLFTSEGGALSLERHVRHGDQTEPLSQTLVALAGGISSGRLPWPQLAATKEEYGVDARIGRLGKATPDAESMREILRALADHPRATLDGKPIAIGSTQVRSWIRATREGRGTRLREARSEQVEATFGNGAAVVKGALRPYEPLPLSDEERALLSAEGKFYPESETRRLITEVLPRLETRVRVEREESELPQAERVPPRLELESRINDGMLEIVPRITYASEYAVRDQEAEQDLARALQARHHLGVNIPSRFTGIDAVAKVEELRRGQLALKGDAIEAFRVRGELAAGIRVNGDASSFEAEFTLGGASASTGSVLQAWRENASLVPLLGGGWAKLPADWLSKHAEQLERLLAAQKEQGDHKLPPQRRLELVELCDGASIPDALAKLRDRLEKFEGIPEAALPSDLRAELRAYQRKGVDWIAFLREMELGGILADDMGLGKTLQTLCAIRGKTLIVAPTSVLHGWAEQAERFRPGLKVNLFHGPSRKLDPSAQVTLTSYGILRTDREQIARGEWEMIVLDEAQTIRNPESQVAQAAHSLRGGFRLALTGTPIENRLEDLWSQFEFVAPGLLGERSEWTVTQLSSEKRDWIRRRIKPFLLRRLKRDVAPELPPRVESVLECELTQAEREFYQALLASSRSDVLAKLGTGEKGSILAALEALLRLRQACCDGALVPGHPDALAAGPSSKTTLLAESLEQSIALGHRALVFSQWTSMLDRIELELRERGIGFVRLDGTTSDRAAVVERFQSPDGPPVFLISLKAGGVGLTLTAADHVYLMDPWWNPAVEDQAADRAHRIGQKNTVFIHRLVAADSIEQRVLDLQKSKAELARAILAGEGPAQEGSPDRITREDLLALLS